MAHRITRPLKITMPNLKVPSDFSVKSYESCYVRAAEKAQAMLGSAQWISEFSPAWLAIAYRFRSCAEYDRSFTASFMRAGGTPGEPERYLQERDLFNFFVTGLSAIESLSYGLYFTGFVLEPNTFKLAASTKDFKKIDLKNTVVPHFMKSTLANEQIIIKLNNLTQQNEYQQWEKIRNILSHRITPVRTGVHNSISSVDPNYSGPTYSHWVDWLEGLKIDEYTTENKRAWLVTTLNDLFQDTDMFFKNKL